MHDITIIGAGITGSLIAYELGKYNLNVLVLEKENDVASGATGANSAMIHSGHDPKTGTLKCKYNLIGSKLYPKLCKDLKVDYKQIGAYVVAIGEEEEKHLDVLVNNCIERDIPYELISGDEARIREKNLSDDICKALYLPSTGIINPWLTCMAAMEEAMLNGVELKLNYEVKKIDKVDDYFLINDDIKTKLLINCAGIHVDDITNMLRTSPYKVEARKGEYFVIDNLDSDYVNSIIYPTPSEKGKGVLAVKTVHDNIMFGPNSDYCDKDDVSTGDGLDYIKKSITKTMKNIPFNKLIHVFAGLRPHIDLNDFYIEEDDEIDNFIHVAGIESPGLSAAPAIAKEVVENIVLKKFDNNQLKDNYIHRKEYIDYSHLSEDEINELIKKDKSFGHIICRCEKISEGVIKDVINRKCGARTIKGVRMRCRPGMGRCQGSFCQSEVLKILARELKVDPSEIEYDKKDSYIVLKEPYEE